MADIRNELFTKEKECIEKLCKKVKRYASHLGITLSVCKSTKKDVMIEWLVSAMSHKDILGAIISDLRIEELSFLNKIYETGKYIGKIDAELYWEAIGLICEKFDEAGNSCSVFSDELTEYINDGGDKLISELGLRSIINSCVCAMVNLYGIISIKKAYDIFCGTTGLSGKVCYNLFAETAVRFTDFRKDCKICVYQNSFVAAEYLEINENRCVKRIVPKPSYYELVSKQGDKPFYTSFSISQLLKYEKPGVFEINSYITEFSNFLADNFDLDSIEVCKIAESVCRAAIEEKGINDIFKMLTEMDIVTSSQKIQKSLVKYIMSIKNSVRLRINRGYTINELRGISYDAVAICSNI